MGNKIYGQMIKIMKSVGTVGKDQKNSAQGYSFRGIDQFVNALHPALVEHGVFMTPRVTSERTEIKEVVRSNGKAGIDKHVSLLVEYDFYADDGSKVTVGPIASEGLDSGDKATNKALSAALKYALIQTFSVPTQDMVDADKDTPEIGSHKVSTKVTVSVQGATESSKVETTQAAASSNAGQVGSFKRPAKAVQAVSAGSDDL